MIKIREEAFRYYFYFMQERMDIFWNKYDGKTPLYSNDLILSQYKFTNVYRACDRVSQYLISNVIYTDGKNYSPEDIVFRILLFKIFNRIETWQFLEKHYGSINIKAFKHKDFSSILRHRIQKQPIFSAAYLMNGTHVKYNDKFKYKHEKWLCMLDDEIIKGKLIDKIIAARSLEEIYELLLTCSFIGPFLAYQFAIDLNYSEVINFDENSFVKAGIGAIRGIDKCFINKAGKSYEYLIEYTFENIDKYRTKFNYSFQNLFGRNPTLIDLQNCFCETDKYLRVALPELNIRTKRIKQKYKQVLKPINYFFPPKWELENIKEV